MQLLTKTLSEMVLENHQTARIFEKYGLDFCCRGNQTLDSACAEQSISPATIQREIEELPEYPNAMREYLWDSPFLIDYIVNNHHNYIKKTLPVLREHLSKVIQVHSIRHPELIRVGQLFESTTSELEQHLLKEEVILFPYIKELMNDRKVQSPFGTVRNPIEAMKNDHVEAGDTFAEIRMLLDNYQPPEDACVTMKVTYKELEQFERDLHEHIFLENSILFPKAIQKESVLH